MAADPTTPIDVTVGTAGKDKASYRQVIVPNYVEATFEVDDVGNHDFLIDGRGKGRMTVHVTNESDVNMTTTLYGTALPTADIGDVGVVQIDGFSLVTTPADNDDYEVVNDPFPFYIARMVGAAGPGDGSDATLRVYLSSA